MEIFSYLTEQSAKSNFKIDVRKYLGKKNKTSGVVTENGKGNKTDPMELNASAKELEETSSQKYASQAEITKLQVRLYQI